MVKSNYAFKPIAEQAFRSNQTIVPQRLNAALDPMKNIAALALLLIGLVAIAAEPNRVRTGRVMEVSTDSLIIDQATAGTVHIGFATDADAVKSLEKIRVGDEVRAVFGSTKDPSGRSINELLSIRVCTKNDEECSADYDRQEAQAKADEAKRAISQKKFAHCMDSMDLTLSKDARYIGEDSVLVTDAYLTKYNALTGAAKACASTLLKHHEASVLEACLRHRCGDNVGGGCWHIAGYSINSSAIQNAVNKCSN